MAQISYTQKLRRQGSRLGAFLLWRDNWEAIMSSLDDALAAADGIRWHAQGSDRMLSKMDLLKGYEQARFRLREIGRHVVLLDRALNALIPADQRPELGVDAEAVCRELGLGDVRFEQ